MTLARYIYVFLYQNLNTYKTDVTINESKDLCISILEFKLKVENDINTTASYLCISILEFKLYYLNWTYRSSRDLCISILEFKYFQKKYDQQMLLLIYVFLYQNLN